MVDFVVRDFLAARDVRLRVSGLTVLRGESYSGKSSTFRAIQAACTNRFSSGVVRWGASHCEVFVRFSDSESFLKVTKGSSGGAVYTLGGVVYDKTRREVPAEVDSFLNLGVVSSGSDRLSLCFWEQFSRPLLRSFSQSRISELLGSGRGLRDWTVCWKALSSRRSEVRAEERVLRDLLDSVRAEHSELAQAYRDSESLAVRISSLLSSHASGVSRLELLSMLRGLLSLREVQSEVLSARRLEFCCLGDMLAVSSRVYYLHMLLELSASRLVLGNRLMVVSGYRESLSRCLVAYLQHRGWVSRMQLLGSFSELLRSSRSSYLRGVSLGLEDGVLSLRARCHQLRLLVVMGYSVRCLDSVRALTSGLLSGVDFALSVLRLRVLLSERGLLLLRMDSVRVMLQEDICPVCGSLLK